MVLALHGIRYLLAKQGIFAAPIGKARQIRSANNKFSDFFIRCALPIGGVRIAGPIVLAQQKGNERIGETWTNIRSASPIVIEIAYLFCCTDRKHVQYETKAK
jgi:hypothetical protein